MKSWEVIGYTYDADVHCIACAEKRFGASALSDDADSPAIDGEGNEVHAMLAGEEHSEDGSAVHCGTCGDEII